MMINRFPLYFLFNALNRTLLFCAVWFSFFLGFSNAVRADQACTGTKANFSYTTGTVCLPAVQVQSPSGTAYYAAQLQSIPNSTPTSFALMNASPIAVLTAANIPTFSTVTGLLNLPVIEQYDLFGTNRYSASLQLQPGGAQSVFALLPTVAAVISPGYAPGVTWKPYVGLLPYEKTDENIMGYSQPYAALADAVYSFSNTAVGTWNLKQTTSAGSGMQAGVYVNSATGQIALAFRGTEFCIDPLSCSFSQLEQSTLDVEADIELSQGIDAQQFKDAHAFAQQMINAYAGQKIVVTGHSLGGGLAQAIGAAFQLPTYAFNSSPVPNGFFSDFGVNKANPLYASLIFVVCDIHDPVSNTAYSGDVYTDASHITPSVFFDFSLKVIAPTYKVTLDDVRFNSHSMDTLLANINATMQVYLGGW